MPESPVLYAVSSIGGACYIQVKVWLRIHRCVLLIQSAGRQHHLGLCTFRGMRRHHQPCIDALYLLPLFRNYQDKTIPNHQNFVEDMFLAVVEQQLNHQSSAH